VPRREKKTNSVVVVGESLGLGACTDYVSVTSTMYSNMTSHVVTSQRHDVTRQWNGGVLDALGLSAVDRLRLRSALSDPGALCDPGARRSFPPATRTTSATSVSHKFVRIQQHLLIFISSGPASWHGGAGNNCFAFPFPLLSSRSSEKFLLV